MNAVTDEHRRHTRIWQFAHSPLARVVIAAAAMIAAMLVLQAVAAVTHFKPSAGLNALAALSLTVAALIATYVGYVRLVERRRTVELAAKSAAPKFAGGFLLGGILFCLIMLALWLAGVVTIGRGAGWSPAGMQLLSALELGVLQAIFFCGILFRIVEGSLGTWLALLLTIVVLGAAHAAGPGATLLSEATIGLEIGTLLPAVYVSSRSLWPIIGLLTAWNFFEGGVFGVSVSGHTESGLLISRFQGPQILTGGTAGPEVTIVALLACLAVAAFLFQRTIRKGSTIAPYWQLKSLP